MGSLKSGSYYRLKVDRPGKDKDSTEDVILKKGTVVKLVRLYQTSVIVMDKENNWTAFQKGLWFSYLKPVSPAEAIQFQRDE